LWDLTADQAGGELAQRDAARNVQVPC
jgi:hypothetical protein